uniref:THO complex 1 n=1 Tax=Kryptolebias marmoratus TaxID=37003 RepID=A0A3Q3A348_KRYMA
MLESGSKSLAVPVVKMSPSLFNFVDAKEKFTTAARHALGGKTCKQLVNVFNQIPGNETEKKTTLDQALRGVLGDQIVRKTSCDDYLSLIYLSIDAVTEGICSATAPFVLLGDVLDCLPLDLCDKIFSFVEENVSTWKSSSFYTAGKNYLLRMCNDLLRRLSKSQNTVFCGRIQLFLARLFPLSEKSGLNLQSQFNLDNVTVFNKNEQETTLGQKTDEKEDGMEVEEGEMGEDDAPASCSIPIDYNLYRKFWMLQDYFRNPLQCFEKFSWITFVKYSDETLAVFKSYKLDDMQASKRKMEELRASDGEHVYFAKFLTSEKLMDLQLSDSNFRRHILVQYLILFQYLKGQVKFKNSSCVLNDDQNTWVEDTTKLVYQHILNTEENWNAWKNEGCPSFVKERTVDEKPKRPTRKRQAPEDFLGKGPDRKIFMGNDELTRLWNLNQDNMEACKSDSREFMPSLDEFFAEAIEQADPVNMVEEEYKVVRNPNYGWRALRLLSRRSPHFFQPTNQKFKSLADYLDSMVSKLAKELPKDIPSEEIKTGEEDDDDNGDNLLKDSNDSPSIQNKLVTNQQMDDIAAKLGAQWKTLASHLEMKAAELREIETDSEDVDMQAKLLLVAWQDREGTQATVENLVTALNAAGFSQIADSLNET